MLQLSMIGTGLGCDPKDSIVDALRVADQLQVEVVLSFAYPWMGMRLVIAPAQSLDKLLAVFDAEVSERREAYMRGSTSHVTPLRPSATAAVLREKLGLPDGG
jgi:hypothetical protein